MAEVSKAIKLLTAYLLTLKLKTEERRKIILLVKDICGALTCEVVMRISAETAEVEGDK